MNKEVIDWRYLAGFFDGEGNVRYVENLKTRSRGVSITIAQAERNAIVIPLIKTFLEKNGLERVHLYITNYKDNRGYKRQPVYVLKIQNKWDVQKFLEAIKNDLIVKKQDAIEILNRIKTLKKHTRPFNSEEEAKIIDMFNKGKSYGKMMKEIGCGKLKIYWWLKGKNLVPVYGSKEWKERISKTKRKNN